MITTTLTSSYHWEILAPFCLPKKLLEEAFLTLTVNYRKIVQKNKLCHSKQQQIGYLMICDVIISSHLTSHRHQTILHYFLIIRFC